MAFPTTSVLDDFNRADEGPPLSTNWSSPGMWGYPPGGPLTLISNEAKGSVSGYYNDAYWNVQTFGPDCEVYAKFSLKSNIAEYVAARITTPGDGTTDGYAAFGITSGIMVARIDNGVYTMLGSVLSATYEDGLSIGLEITDDTIVTFTKPPGGSWANAGERTDSTYSSAGYIIIGTHGQGGSIDDFGGGTIYEYVPTGGLTDPDFSKFPKFFLRR